MKYYFLSLLILLNWNSVYGNNQIDQIKTHCSKLIEKKPKKTLSSEHCECLYKNLKLAVEYKMLNIDEVSYLEKTYASPSYSPPYEDYMKYKVTSDFDYSINTECKKNLKYQISKK